MKWVMWIAMAALFGVAGLQAETNRSVAALLKPAATNEPTVVTSDRLSVDYAKNMGTFEGNVLAIDPRITVRADKVIAYFGAGTNTSRQVQRMVAEGSVVISQDTRKATSDRAEYVAAEGRVTLTGNPKVESPEGAITGQRITFWQGQEKMDVESGSVTDTNRTRLIFYPEEQRKKDE
jgi:lipopolysaccharide export system protein LptA